MRDRGQLVPAAAPGQLATAILAALQGGLLLAQVERNVRPLAAALDVMISLVASLAPPARPALHSQQSLIVGLQNGVKSGPVLAGNAPRTARRHCMRLGRGLDQRSQLREVPAVEGAIARPGRRCTRAADRRARNGGRTPRSGEPTAPGQRCRPDPPACPDPDTRPARHRLLPVREQDR
jgi:hypothetical protein